MHCVSRFNDLICEALCDNVDDTIKEQVLPQNDKPREGACWEN